MMVKHKESKISKQEKVTGQINFAGNWNYKKPEEEKIISKPIGVVTMYDHEVVFAHEDLLKLLSIYHESDLIAVSMINSENVDTGLITHAESLFIEKVKEWVSKAEKGLK